MTTAEIQTAIETAFRVMYRDTPVHVHGAGDETIRVEIGCDIDCHPEYVWVCELDSDDDGHFHFHLDDCTATVLVPFPGAE